MTELPGWARREVAAIKAKQMTFCEEIAHESELREYCQRHRVRWGIPYFDDCTYGILPIDTVILTGTSGTGKTTLATMIARKMAEAGRRVVFFALEAMKAEVVMRMRFQMLVEAFFCDPNVPQQAKEETFFDFEGHIVNEYDKVLSPYYKTVDFAHETLYRRIQPVYKQKADYTVKDFRRDFAHWRDHGDVFILDHINFFDTDSRETEVECMCEVIKAIRYCTIETRKPFLIVSQLRKQSTIDDKLLPSQDDIYSSSHIRNIATKIVVIGTANDQERTSRLGIPNYMRVLKNRWANRGRIYTAKTDYRVDTNSYSDRYVLGKLGRGSKEWTEIERDWVPGWAKNSEQKRRFTG
jgi:energy-coupling factor transporter ATP-binding protein EcfA2